MRVLDKIDAILSKNRFTKKIFRTLIYNREKVKIKQGGYMLIKYFISSV